MSFSTLLAKIVEDCGGGIGIALMGNDGIAIEQVMAREPAVALEADDVGAAGVEFGRILDEIGKASDSLGGGALAETVVRLARFTLIFHGVDAENFLVLALAPDGNLGKARYLLRSQLHAIRAEF
ncbi:MAG: roadblock/LC7 domain-containing protein [Myxococcales bacterium]|nr:roadblock/LC7 domain-containing protein [Myxococcales bacterium]